MKRKITLVVLLALLAMGCSSMIYAHAPKKKGHKKHQTDEQAADNNGSPKLSRKEERRKARTERRKLKHERKLERKRKKYGVENASNNEQPAENNTAFKYPASTKKDRYRIDIFAAIYLDELVKSRNKNNDRIPDKALQGVSFYEGVSIAADSLKRAGFNIDIYVHDATSANESPQAMMNSGGLDSSDLVIAALQADYLPALAEYAKKKKINFVSAFTPSDGGITNNKYFTMLLPTLKTHCEWIGADVAKKFPGMKVTLLYRTALQSDENAFKYMTGTGKINFNPYLCATLPRKDELAALFDTTRPNIVVIPILDHAFADSLLKRISKSFPSTQFEIYGMPSWNNIAGLRKEDAFPNLSINVTTPYNIEATNPYLKYVAFIYKNSFGGKASESVFLGYETIFWYANLLKQYGTIFNQHYADGSPAPFTKFDLKPQRDNEGHILYNENKHVYLSRYEGGACKTE